MLTSEQVAFFRENGYLLVEDFYSVELIEEYKTAVEEARHIQGKYSIIHNKGGPYSNYEQKVNLWRDFPKIRALTLDPRRASLVQQLMGAREVRVFHDHYLIKPSLGSASSWHQDHPAWPMAGEGPINCWIPFQDVTLHNGAMAYVHGSHKWGLVKYTVSRDDEQISVAGKSAAVTKIVPVPVKAGSFLFHHGLTLHYAFPNQSDQPRYAMTVIYMPDWMTYNGKSHIVTDGVGLEIGQPFHRDELFPVVCQT